MCFCVAREDKLNVDNRSVVNDFQADLVQQLGSLCNTLATSMSRQNEHLQCIEKLCQSFLDIHNKVLVKFWQILFYHFIALSLSLCICIYLSTYLIFFVFYWNY